MKITLGCDPEFFFSRGGRIIGAEKVLPEQGIDTPFGKIIIDGIQGELNPNPSDDPHVLADNVLNSFRELRKVLSGAELDFSQTVTIKKAEMDTLSEKSKQFGCSPSLNTSGGGAIDIDASKYLKRSAGGHIHIGHGGNEEIKSILANTQIIVPLLDIIVGNTCVLIDRDRGNIERRKIYGKASEYRLPPHGLEYRTLSNFWLKDKKTMVYVFELVQRAVNEAGNWDKFFKCVNMKEIRTAINTNNYKLADKNYQKIKHLLCQK